MFEVILSPAAAEFYAAADQALASKLARCFRGLESDPRRGNNVKRLKGDWSAYHRYRVGDWRVVYRIDDAASHVYVVVIAHRRDVYE
jgi:mRNA interferase RelE/StbE